MQFFARWFLGHPVYLNKTCENGNEGVLYFKNNNAANGCSQRKVEVTAPKQRILFDCWRLWTIQPAWIFSNHKWSVAIAQSMYFKDWNTPSVQPLIRPYIVWKSFRYIVHKIFPVSKFSVDMIIFHQTDTKKKTSELPVYDSYRSKTKLVCRTLQWDISMISGLFDIPKSA